MSNPYTQRQKQLSVLSFHARRLEKSWTAYYCGEDAPGSRYRTALEAMESYLSTGNVPPIALEQMLWRVTNNLSKLQDVLQIPGCIESIFWEASRELAHASESDHGSVYFQALAREFRFKTEVERDLSWIVPPSIARRPQIVRDVLFDHERSHFGYKWNDHRSQFRSASDMVTGWMVTSTEQGDDEASKRFCASVKGAMLAWKSRAWPNGQDILTAFHNASKAASKGSQADSMWAELTSHFSQLCEASDDYFRFDPQVMRNQIEDTELRGGEAGRQEKRASLQLSHWL